MKNRKRTSFITVLILFTLLLCVVLTGCDRDKSHDDDHYVEGNWVLDKVETTYLNKGGTTGERTYQYSSTDYTHKMQFNYNPDSDDPTDGKTPFEAVFSCTIDIPESFNAGSHINVLLEAKAEYDEKPGHTTGVCCCFGVVDPSRNYMSNEWTHLTSAGSYHYDFDYQRYPIYAGIPVGYNYGSDTTYTSSMSDKIDVQSPPVNINSYNEREKDPPKLIFGFYSNAAQTVFEYKFVANSDKE